MFDLVANVTVAGLSVISSRALEQYDWFQRLAPETKRLIAVAIAAFIALAMHMIGAIAQNAEPQSIKAAFSTALAIVIQQIYHALAKEDAQ
jgi:alkylhydroperoxidase/carboxymuconolactone decarboxylase family protein YurZ